MRTSPSSSEKYCLQVVDAVVLSAPYYFKYPAEIVENFFLFGGSRADMPVILYNIPPYANEINLASLRRLLEVENIVATKDRVAAWPTCSTFSTWQRLCGVISGVMVGWEEMLLAALTCGAHGCMVASGGILPELMTAIGRHYQAREFDQAARIQRLVAKATGANEKRVLPLWLSNRDAGAWFRHGRIRSRDSRRLCRTVTRSAKAHRTDDPGGATRSPGNNAGRVGK